MVRSGWGDLHPCRPILAAIQDMLKRSWQVQVIHRYREANQVADFLANMAHRYALFSGNYS